jgi:hypothetical protein
MLVAAPCLFVGLLAGYVVRRWSVVAAVAVVGLAASVIGWQASWFATEDTPALGGAIVFALVIWLPLTFGAAAGVYFGRSRSTRRSADVSSLPVVPLRSRKSDRS